MPSKISDQVLTSVLMSVVPLLISKFSEPKRDARQARFQWALARVLDSNPQLATRPVDACKAAAALVRAELAQLAEMAKEDELEDERVRQRYEGSTLGDDDKAPESSDKPTGVA